MRYTELRGTYTSMVLVGLMLACSGNSVTEPPIDPSPAPSASPSVPLPFPLPQPTPASCPPLQEWGVKIHLVMDAAFQPTSVIEEGGHVVLDSTPKFQVGGPNGQPCNNEHDNCGGRECEDPRGGVWTKLKGDSSWKIELPGPDSGFQVHVGSEGGLKSGQHEFKVCPRGDIMDGTTDGPDGQGLPVQVLAGACDTIGFFVP